MPRIEVRADHHDLVASVASRKFADDVEGVEVVVVKPVLRVDFDGDGDSLLKVAGDQPVVLDGERDLRGNRRIIDASRASALHEHRPASGRAATRIDQTENA